MNHVSNTSSLAVVQTPGEFTIPASAFTGCSKEVLALLCGASAESLFAQAKPALERQRSFSSQRTWSYSSKSQHGRDPLHSAPLHPTTYEDTPPPPLYKSKFDILQHVPAEARNPKRSEKTFWSKVKVVAKDINYAVNYNGQKDASTKKVSLVTRVAAIALPVIQTFIPEFQIVVSAYKTAYSGAQMLGLVDKDVKVTKEKKTSPIQSSLSRGILSVGIAVAAYFSSRIGVVVFAVLKIGLDMLDLRNSIVENGWTKESTLILIKMAGTVAYIALAIFDSNLVLIFNIAAKVAVNFFTAYCEASQGRWPEAIAAVVFAGLTNLSSIQSVVQSAQAGTLPDRGNDAISSTSTAGVTDMRPDETDTVFEDLTAAQEADKRKRKKQEKEEKERLEALQRRRLHAMATKSATAQAI